MIERANIERILHISVHAPSGDNSQPWTFQVKGDEIFIIAHPERDHAMLNVEARGTYIAIGALIENIFIASRHAGYDPELRLFPNDEAAASVTLRRASAKSSEPLYDFISRRHTHRGAYRSHIDHSFLTEISTFNEGSASLRIITDKTKLSELGRASSMMEHTALCSEALHGLFFESIIWEKDHNDLGMPGLYIKTTELPPPIQTMFRLIRHWPITRILNKFGLAKAAASSNAVIYARSGAAIAVETTDISCAGMIDIGRLTQRVWLTATKSGLAAQPLAGLLYLAQYVELTDASEFSQELKTLILNAKHSIDQIFDTDNRIAMVLRVGEPRKPASARSTRKKPDIHYYV